MKIAFAGLRHAHIFQLADLARQTPSVEIAGVWEENPEAAAAANSLFSEKWYSSYEALLEDQSVDIVAIGDYYGIRGQRILQALTAGKHILTDKPVCTSLEELNQIEKLCNSKHLSLGCMLDLRYDPSIRLAHEIISSGRLGEIHALSFSGQHPLQWGTRPKWYFEEGKHGGTFNDIAIHGLDAVQMITGLPYTKTLHARQWNAFAKEAPEFCDCAQVIGKLSNGAGLIADVSYSAPDGSAFILPSYWRFTFWGEKGYLECRYGEGAVTLALAPDKHPVQIKASFVEDNCLSDLIREINGEKILLGTQSILCSSRTALELQRFADRKD